MSPIRSFSKNTESIADFGPIAQAQIHEETQKGPVRKWSRPMMPITRRHLRLEKQKTGILKTVRHCHESASLPSLLYRLLFRS